MPIFEIDLSTLANYPSLTAGQYNLTIVCKGDSTKYIDSDKSNEYSWTKSDVPPTPSNLMGNATYYGGYGLASATNTITGSTAVNGIFGIPITAGTTYTIVKNYKIGAIFRVAFASATPSYGVAISGYTDNNAGDKVIVTAPAGATYLYFQVHGGSNDGDIHENMRRLMSVWESDDAVGYSVSLGTESPSFGGYVPLYIKLNSLPTAGTDASFYADSTYKTGTYDYCKLCLYNGTEITNFPITLNYITDISAWLDNPTQEDVDIKINNTSGLFGLTYESAGINYITQNSTVLLQSMTDD